MAALIPDEKCCVCLDKKAFLLLKNRADYHTGLVSSSTTDGASLEMKVKKTQFFLPILTGGDFSLIKTLCVLSQLHL